MKRTIWLAVVAALAGAGLHLALRKVARVERSDLPLYLDRTLRWADGETPYRDFAFEYPPAALLVLSVPLHAAAATGARYEETLAIWLALFDALALFSAWLAVRGRRGWLAMAVCWLGLALCGSVLHTRFDLVPGALMALALALLAVDPVAAGAALGAAAAIKLYPLAMAPALAVAAWRTGKLRAALLAGALTALLLSLPAALGAGAAASSFLSYHLQRGVQMQSLWASLVMVAHSGEVPMRHAFGAEELAQVPAIVAPLSLLLQLTCGLGAAWRVYRGGSPRTAALAAFAGFVAFGKVGSPQFLLALVPVAACAALDAPWAAAAIVTSCALMCWEFPAHYGGLFHNQAPWAAVVLIRMSLVAGVSVLLLLRSSRATAAQNSASTSQK